MSKKGRVVSVMMMLIMVFTLIPMNVNAASSSKKVKTYIFFGSDSRAAGDAWKKDKETGTEGAPRSDSIMLLTVNDKKKTITVTSIYRDTMLEISGKGKEYGKANKAYSNVGPKKAVKIFEKNLGIKIDGYAVTNFKGVADAIDKLGGVTINVENDTIEKTYQKKNFKKVPAVINNLIDQMNYIYGTNEKHIKSGKQKLTGLQAVSYARVRYTKGSDKMRTVRQRKVLKQMYAKFKKKSTKKKVKIIAGVYSSIQTNISASKFKKLLKKVSGSKYKIVMGKGFPYYKRDKELKSPKERQPKSWYVIPCDLKKNVEQLHKKVYLQKKYKVTKATKKYSSKIAKKSKLSYKKRNKGLDNKY